VDKKGMFHIIINITGKL